MLEDFKNVNETLRMNIFPIETGLLLFSVIESKGSTRYIPVPNPNDVGTATSLKFSLIN